MDSQLRSQVVFHLTGRRADPAAEGNALPAGLRPALLAPYRQLDSIRHDFPVILAAGEGEYAVALCAAVDGALRKVAPEGLRGEAMRKRALHIEREIRRRTEREPGCTLREHWDAAVDTFVRQTGADTTCARELQLVRDALPVDGVLAACDASLPRRFIEHAWSVAQDEKARAALQRSGELALRLEAILRADHARSAEALRPSSLQATFGGTHRSLFDFASMSTLLSHTAARGGLDAQRRDRIGWALATLQSQTFFKAPRLGIIRNDEARYADFQFTDVASALAAFRRRLPDMVSLLKALQIGELEVEGQYVQELHGPIFERMDERSLTAQDFQFFPDYLICLRSDETGVQATLSDALSSGMPVKVLLHVDDLLEEAAPGRGRFSFSLRSGQIAAMAMSSGDAFVLQGTASNLLQMRDSVQRGLHYPGPALFSIFAPPATGTGLPGYLAAASAMQSRAFPAFSYDPGAGSDIASRFSLENNPQPERDWPLETLTYADQDLQSVTEEVAFTFVDYLLCDARHAQHFAVVPRAAWHDGLIPARQWLENPPADATTGVPCIAAVDDADLLCRLVVDEELMRVALRCLEAWRRLQELGGIRDARAERLLAREKLLWEQQHAAEIVAAPLVAVAPAVESTASQSGALAAADAAAADTPVRNPDEAYIETLRCSSCNECTLASPKMFAYDDNKQAYITDRKAGTYRQLVEAAESCQVSVIHPGKPWNADEPGLDELIERAKPFL
jgi:ferredoxin